MATFGNTVEEYSARTQGSGYLTVSKAVLAAQAYVAYIRIYLNNQSATDAQVFKPCVYSDTGAGYPDDLVISGSEQSVPANTALAWWEYAVDPEILLSAGTYYIGSHCGTVANGIQLRRGASGSQPSGSAYETVVSYAGGLPATFPGSVTPLTRLYSAYGEDSGSPNPPVIVASQSGTGIVITWA